MAELTTAQRLAAYRDELTAEGFEPGITLELVREAAQHLHRDDDGPTVRADLEADQTPCAGVTHVRLVPHLDREAMADVLKDMQARALQSSPLGLAPRPPYPW